MSEIIERKKKQHQVVRIYFIIGKRNGLTLCSSHHLIGTNNYIFHRYCHEHFGLHETQYINFVFPLKKNQTKPSNLNESQTLILFNNVLVLSHFFLSFHFTFMVLGFKAKLFSKLFQHEWAQTKTFYMKQKCSHKIKSTNNK